MLDLAIHGNGESVKLKDAAKRQAISEKYLWQVVNPLKAAGLITTVRGAGGGYALAKPPSRITLRDILALLEGDCSLVDCVQSPGSCERSAECVAREVWKELDMKLAAAMESITLEDMAEKQRACADNSKLMYSI